MSNWRALMKSLLATIVSLLMLAAANPIPAQPFAYITNQGSNDVSVIDIATNTVVATLWAGGSPIGVAVNPAGTRVYWTSFDTINEIISENTVNVMDTVTNIVVGGARVGSAPTGVAVNPAGTRAYVTNNADGTVSVMDTATNTVVATVAVGGAPIGVAVNAAGTRVYVTNAGSGVSVIDTATNTVVDTVAVGSLPYGVAVNPAGTRAFVANLNSNNVSVIDTATNTLVATVAVGAGPIGVAVNPAGTRVYVTNNSGSTTVSGTVSVIDTATNTVVATVAVGANPFGVAINPAGTSAYVANTSSNNVSVIDTATNTVVANVAVGTAPLAFGLFIGTPPSATVPSAPSFATATPGNGQATIVFAPPASNGGLPITGYTVTCNPGAFSANGAASPLTVTGLTIGTAYSCSVTATNGIGPSAPSNTVTVTPVAPAPGFSASATVFVFSSQSVGTTSTALTITITNTGTAALILSAPTIIGPFAGSFAVSANTCASVVPTATCAISVRFTPIIVGAATGQLIIATNVPATPQYVGDLIGGGTAAAPGAPAIGTATPGNGQATIVFAPPASNGGLPITGYTVTCNPGAFSANGAASPLTVTGLTNGTAYSCSMTATNGIGSSAPSNTVTVTPVALTPAFSASGTTFGFGSQSVGTTSTALTLTITNTGTAALTLSTPTIIGPFAGSFAVSANTCASVVPAATCTISVTFTPIIVGAATGQLIIATNVPATPQYVGSLIGTGTVAAPGAPTIGSATPGNGQATIAFTPPASNGGSPITGHTATCNPGALSANGAASPLTVTGLTNGTAYTCTVTATNAIGTSAPSASVNVTPVAPLSLIGVQARKDHGSAGTHALPVDTSAPITGNVTVEPRGIGAGHRIVFAFSDTVTTVGSATAVNGAAQSITANVTASGNEVTVSLPVVPDNSRVFITLTGVNSSAGGTAAVGFLVGDTNNTRSVNFTDIGGVKARSGQVTTALNFMFDLSASGAINAADIAVVKARSGLTLP